MLRTASGDLQRQIIESLEADQPRSERLFDALDIDVPRRNRGVL